MRKGEPIGQGTEKRVFDTTLAVGGKEQILAEFKEKKSEEQMKSIFYLTKIMRLLFPNNVPDVHSAGYKQGGYFMADKLSRDETHLQINELKRQKYAGKLSRAELEEMLNLITERTDNPKVQDFVSRAEASGFWIDDFGQNFSIDKQGDVSYFDLSPAFEFGPVKSERRFIRCYDENKMRAALKKLPEKQRDKGFYYLDQLKRLEQDFVDHFDLTE